MKKKFVLFVMVILFTISCKKERLELLPETEVITLPVIFHILHNGENIGEGDNLLSSVIYEQFDTLNKQFRGEDINGINTFIQFKLATKLPNGNILNETGINRIYVNQDSFDFTSFHNDSKWKRDLIWNPDEYINIFIVDFGKTETSVATYPYMTNGHELDGLQTRTEKNWAVFPYSMGLYISKKAFMILHWNDGPRILSHEMGHYLGLKHVYSDNLCEMNGDYCLDTHDYNRETYDSNPIGMERNGCDGINFTSENFMDAGPCFNHQFTKDQIKRMRHVCSFSPLRCKLRNSSKRLKQTTPKIAEICEPLKEID